MDGGWCSLFSSQRSRCRPVPEEPRRIASATRCPAGAGRSSLDRRRWTNAVTVSWRAAAARLTWACNPGSILRNSPTVPSAGSPTEKHPLLDIYRHARPPSVEGRCEVSALSPRVEEADVEHLRDTASTLIVGRSACAGISTCDGTAYPRLANWLLAGGLADATP
jgi:hypothetical protein